VMIGGLVSSEKQLILIIITAVAVFGWQLWRDKKKKHDEKLQRHLSKYFDSKW
jgi:predicted negative regulator of RcsB-dependent stress response